MTTFTIATNTNIDACAGGTGGHVYNISAGAILTYDQDSRAGVNSSTSNSIERIVTAATGGTTLIDGRYIRLIPFTGGSGTLTIGATIDCGSATGTAIAVYTSLTAAPADTGESGWIKVKGWNSVAYPTSGEFTKGGFTFTISGADVVGWIEVLADEGTTAEPGLAITGTYLGQVEFRGAWFELGDTNGTAGQTFQIPTNGQYCYIPGVFIEETDGAGDFEFYANVANATAIGTEAARGKVCWIANTGVVTLGHNGATAAGYTPESGLRVVVGNIITSHCTAAARTANVIPNATLANRFQVGLTTATVRGRYWLDKCSLSWRLWFENAAVVNVSNCGTFDDCNVINAGSLSMSNFGIGLSADISNTYQLDMGSCLQGGTLSRIRIWKSRSANSGFRLMGCSAMNLSDITVACARAPASAYSAGLAITRCTQTVIEGLTVICGMLDIVGGSGTTVTDFNFASTVTGETVSTYGQYAIYAESGTQDNIVNGVGFLGLTNVHPYTALVATSTVAVEMRVVGAGSCDAPLDLGSAYATGYVASAAVPTTGLNLQRCYVTNSRTGFINDSIGVKATTVWSSGDDYAQAARPLATEASWRGVKCAGTLGSSDALQGVHFWDAHTSATVGRLILLMHPPTAATTARVTFTASATAYWTGSNGLYLKAIGDTCTWEQGYYMIGHTGFSGAPVMAGGTLSDYLVEYSIDLNDGVGWRAFETASQVNLEDRNASISAVLGFKMKVRITCSTANTAAITSIYFATTSTTTTQAYQYKMYETPIVVHAIDATTLAAVVGAVVYIEAGTGGEYTATTELGRGVTDSSGNCTIVVKHDASQVVNGVVRKSSATPFYSQGVLQATVAPGVTQTITVALVRED
jgi:hypothetical protein